MESVIACVMLTADRPHMAARAVRSFLAQDYENRALVIYDTGKRLLFEDYPELSVKISLRSDNKPRVVYLIDTGDQLPLCELMNHITELAMKFFNPELIAKWDDDDVSDRRRLSRQRSLAFQGGHEVVGYNAMPFVMPDRSVRLYNNPQPTYALGTSLMYSPGAWKSFPFPDTTQDARNGRGSDTLFVHHHARRGRLMGISSLDKGGPMMVATIHEANTTAKLEKCVPLATLDLSAAALLMLDQA